LAGSAFFPIRPAETADEQKAKAAPATTPVTSESVFEKAHPRRSAVERTFAWLTAQRRLARDYERDPGVSEAMIRWDAINTITRRIARGCPTTRQQRRTFRAAG
jgi:hypothetical protein